MVFHNSFQEREYTKSAKRDQSWEKAVFTRSRNELNKAFCGFAASAGVSNNQKQLSVLNEKMKTRSCLNAN